MNDTTEAKELLIGNVCKTCSFFHRLEKYCIQGSEQPKSENDTCNMYSKFNSDTGFNTAEYTEMERNMERRRWR